MYMLLVQETFGGLATRRTSGALTETPKGAPAEEGQRVVSREQSIIAVYMKAGYN